MKQLIYSVFVLALPSMVQAVPTTYRAVQMPYHAQATSRVEPYSAHYQSQWYKGQPQQNNHVRRSYPQRRPMVSIGAAHVDINIYPQTNSSYQHIEEVYLPQGGTYRSVTTTISDDPWYNAPRGRIQGQGHYNAH